MPNPLQPIVDMMYGNPNERGPYFYPASPYGLGDLVPGNMPTRFGPLMPIPEAGELLATYQAASVPAEYFAASPERGAGQPAPVATREALPVNLTATRPDAGVPVNGLTFMRPMPTVMHPRVTDQLGPASQPFACWVSEHPILSLGIVGLAYFAFRGGKS